jgi:hypothetical protein
MKLTWVNLWLLILLACAVVLVMGCEIQTTEQARAVTRQQIQAMQNLIASCDKNGGIAIFRERRVGKGSYSGTYAICEDGMSGPAYDIR